MADRNALVKEFGNISGLDNERSWFYLESSGWDLNGALSNFYDADPSFDTEEPEHLTDQGSSPTEISGVPSRFATAADFHTHGESSSSEDEGQAFYAGGSERSGQQILGPPKKKPDADRITKEVFDAAKRHGATSVEEEQNQQGKGKRTFQGAGFRLGSDTAPSEQVTPFLNRSAPENRGVASVVLKFWSNGFSVDDGPLRSFDDPKNKEFLDAVKRGEVPHELTQTARGKDVDVKIEDHRTEEFVKPKQKVKPFQGAGQMLGSPVPQISQETSTATAAPSSFTFEVNDSEPVTTLQIRLADGTRLVSKFNHSSTIADVRQLIQRSQPNVGNNFKLLTSFPKKELTNENETLAEAKLLNAVIMQRLT